MRRTHDSLRRFLSCRERICEFWTLDPLIATFRRRERWETVLLVVQELVAQHGEVASVSFWMTSSDLLTPGCLSGRCETPTQQSVKHTESKEHRSYLLGSLFDDEIAAARSCMLTFLRSPRHLSMVPRSGEPSQTLSRSVFATAAAPAAVHLPSRHIEGSIACCSTGTFLIVLHGSGPHGTKKLRRQLVESTAPQPSTHLLHHIAAALAVSRHAYTTL